MSTSESEQPSEKKDDDINEDIIIMQTFIKSVLLSNQIIMIIIFIILWYLSNSAAGQIQDAIAEFQSPCIPAGPSGKVGWKWSFGEYGSVSTCDLSNNTPSQTVTSLLNGIPALDLSGNTQNATAVWVGFGVTMSLILMFAPYLLFIPKVIIRGILWIIGWIGYYFIKNPKPEEMTPQQAAKDQNEIATEARDKMWNTFANLMSNFVPTKNSDPDKKKMIGGSTLEDFLESFAENVGGDKGDCGGVIRFFIGLVQIIFLLIFSELNSGNSLRITTMLFSLFISLIFIFMLLGSLKPDPNYKFTFIISAVVLGLVFILLQIFFSKNMSMITQIISSVCLILSISLSIYSTTDPKDFESSSLSKSSTGGKIDNKRDINYENIHQNLGNIINTIGNGKFEDLFNKEKENIQEGGGEPEEPAESLGCLIYNFCSAIQDSFGFSVAKIILIILGIVFLPNFNNSSVNKMMQDSYKTPKYIFTGIVILFIILYTLIPGYSLWKASKNENQEKLNKIPFYTTACKFISLQICGIDINNSSCSS